MTPQPHKSSQKKIHKGKYHSNFNIIEEPKSSAKKKQKDITDSGHKTDRSSRYEKLSNLPFPVTLAGAEKRLVNGK